MVFSKLLLVTGMAVVAFADGTMSVDGTEYDSECYKACMTVDGVTTIGGDAPTAEQAKCILSCVKDTAVAAVGDAVGDVDVDSVAEKAKDAAAAAEDVGVVDKAKAALAAAAAAVAEKAGDAKDAVGDAKDAVINAVTGGDTDATEVPAAVDSEEDGHDDHGHMAPAEGDEGDDASKYSGASQLVSGVAVATLMATATMAL